MLGKLLGVAVLVTLWGCTKNDTGKDTDTNTDTGAEVPVTDGGTVIGTQRYNLVGFAAGPQAGEPAEYGQTVMADVHTLEDGSYRMYYTTRHETGNHLRVAHSADARSWNALSTVCTRRCPGFITS